MITVKIGQQERQLADLDEGWVSREIRRLRAAGENMCVRVRIDAADSRMMLSTPGCPAAGGGRPPTPAEQRIFDLWNARGLNVEGFHGRQLVAFLKQVERLL